jgi:4-hydroxy-3-methylbut-2-en-1-yl diphosphate reductase
MRIVIDSKSGFCFGVVNAIRKAEEALASEGKLYSLGDIVHNGAEVGRLAEMGLITLSREEFFRMKNCRVLIRAHGEPPETYDYARENNIELIDATCPVVLKLQSRIRNSYEEIRKQDGQLVIFGKPGHAEVEGLNGQTGHNAIIISKKEDLEKIDFTRPVSLYSQTTKPLDEFLEIAETVRQRADVNTTPEIKDTVCRQVSGRAPHLEKFAGEHDVIIFVSGKKSSNGAVLFNVCKGVNQRSHMISDVSEIESQWFELAGSAGICGATSTPQWLMEEVAAHIGRIT